MVTDYSYWTKDGQLESIINYNIICTPLPNEVRVLVDPTHLYKSNEQQRNTYLAVLSAIHDPTAQYLLLVSPPPIDNPLFEVLGFDGNKIWDCLVNALDRNIFKKYEKHFLLQGFKKHILLYATEGDFYLIKKQFLGMFKNCKKFYFLGSTLEQCVKGAINSVIYALNDDKVKKSIFCFPMDGIVRQNGTLVTDPTLITEILQKNNLLKIVEQNYTKLNGVDIVEYKIKII